MRSCPRYLGSPLQLSRTRIGLEHKSKAGSVRPSILSPPADVANVGCSRSHGTVGQLVSWPCPWLHIDPIRKERRPPHCFLGHLRYYSWRRLLEDLELCHTSKPCPPRSPRWPSPSTASFIAKRWFCCCRRLAVCPAFLVLEETSRPAVGTEPAVPSACSFQHHCLYVSQYILFRSHQSSRERSAHPITSVWNFEFDG